MSMSQNAGALAISLWMGVAPAQGEQPTHDMSTLMRFEWTLRDARSHSGERKNVYFPPTGRPLVLVFETPGHFSVVGDCNRFSGGYVLSDGVMRKDPSPQSLRTATVMGCDYDRLATDAAAISFFDAEPRYRIRDVEGVQGLPLLELEADSGDRLEFRGRLTLSERFGSSGRHIHLEVQPAFVRCPSSTQRGFECLRVREVHELPAVPVPGRGDFDYSFEAREDWHTLQQEIEGFVPRGRVPLVIGVRCFDQELAVPGRATAGCIFESVFAGDGWIDDWAWRNSHADWTPTSVSVIEPKK